MECGWESYIAYGRSFNPSKLIKDIGILFRVNKELKNRIRRQGTHLHTEEVFSTYRNKSEMKILEE